MTPTLPAIASLPPTLDRSAVDAFGDVSAGGGPDFVAALIDQYLQEAAVQIATIADAAERLDWPRVKSTAHSLKGSSLVMGALRLAALCAQLEDQVTRQTGAALPSNASEAIARELGCVRDAFASEGQS